MLSQRNLGTLVSVPAAARSTDSYTVIGDMASELTVAFAVIEMRFETGEEKLKDLETGVFVGAGRFIVEQGKPVTVEYKLSKVVKGSP